MEMNSVRVDMHNLTPNFNGPAAATADHRQQLVVGQLSSDSQSSSNTASPATAASDPLFASSPEPRPEYEQSSSSASAIDAVGSVTIITVQTVPETRPPAAADPAGHNSKTRAQAMKSLKESIPHKMKLQKLNSSDRQYQKEGSGHKKDVRRLSKQLYIILGWYAVMQSALFAAVAQTSIFTCDDWWGPAAIAGIVTLGTLTTVLDKLNRIGQQQQKVLQSQHRQNAVWDKIVLLYQHGSSYSLDALEPHHENVYAPDPGLLCVFSLYGLLVLGFLAGFSGLIIVSCLRVLCASCKCHEY